MITPGSRFWFALAGLSALGAAVYFLASGNDKYGSLVLAFAAVAALIPAVAGVALRDGTAPAGAPDGAGPAAGIAATRAPAIWPALGALGAGVSVVGLASGGALLYVGFAVLAATLVEWMVQAWAERSSGDPRVNQALRNRIMYPIEFPALAALGAALVVLSFSRVLLAVSKTSSTVVAIVVASAILAAATLLSARPRLSSSLLTGVVVAGALALLGGGIVGAVAGEREFEAHGGGHEDEEAEAGGHEDEAPDGGGHEDEAPAGAGHEDEAPAGAEPAAAGGHGG